MDKPIWFNCCMREIAINRNRLFRNYKRGGKLNKSIHKLAVQKRKEFVKACTQAKCSFYKEQLVLNKKDQCKFCKTINELLGASSDVAKDRVFKHGTEIILNEWDSVVEINTFFAESN